MKIEVKTYAKINLLLDICAKRKDGYHELLMVMQSIGIYDTVTVQRVKGREITITCNQKDIPVDSRNIAYKAAEAFFAANRIRVTSRGIHIDIKKRIPHAAGLAGGSADGAAVITALNELYATKLSAEELCRIGVRVGADVPFCIVGGTKLCQGIGEVMSDLKPLKRCYITLVKPDFGVNTGKAYAQFDSNGKTHSPDCLGMLKAIQKRDLNGVGMKLENVFEQFIEVPDRIYMKEILRENGALGVCMSGSGPTVYGIFDNKDKAQKAAGELAPYGGQITVCLPSRYGCKLKIIE